MTIYVKNLTQQDISYMYKGEYYLFPSNTVCSLNETILPYSLLQGAYGSRAIDLIENPTQEQINNAVQAIQLYNTGLSSEAEEIISGSFGIKGELNARRVNYLLLVQAIKDSQA